MLKLVARLWPLLLLVVVVLFPFEWLGAEWSSFGNLIFRIFPTENQHAIGHLGIFSIFGFTLLRSFPSLRFHLWRYLGSVLLAGLCEETIQTIFKPYLDVIDTAHDLALDLIAASAVFGLLKLWDWSRKRKKGQPIRVH